VTRRILLVEDEQDIAQGLIFNLQAENYLVTHVESGEAALDHLQSQPCKLVILDLMLPDLGGDEVFDELRKINPDINVLLVSGFKRDPRIADLLIRGCDGFLKKPYSIEELSQAIRDIIDEEDEVKT